MPPLPADDLAAILTATAPLWPELANQRLLLTGGTGFFGTWLTESFLHINTALGLNAGITVLTRNPEAFRRKAPHLAHDSALTLLEGDVRDFRFPAAPHTHIIHAATEASPPGNSPEHPHQMLSTILAGTGRTLDFAAHTGARKLLLTSSGAVYGTQTMPLMPEDYPGAPDPLLPGSVYGEGKRASELMCSLAAGPSFEIKVARCYAFLGPHLPLDAHFAAGNFLRDALAGTPSTSPRTARPCAPTSMPPISRSRFGPCSSVRPRCAPTTSARSMPSASASWPKQQRRPSIRKPTSQ